MITVSGKRKTTQQSTSIDSIQKIHDTHHDTELWTHTKKELSNITASKSTSTKSSKFPGMRDTEILQNLARSGHLAAQTHKRALTRSLLNKVLDCSLVQDAKPRSHMVGARYESSIQGQSYNNRFKLRDFTSNSSEYEERREDEPSNWVYYKTFDDQQSMQKVDSQQDKEKHSVEQLKKRKKCHWCKETNGDDQHIREDIEQRPDCLKLNKGHKYVETQDDYIFMKKNCMQDVAKDNGKEYVRKENNHEYVLAEKGFQCIEDDDSHEHLPHDEYSYVREENPHQHTKHGCDWQDLRKDHLYFRKTADDKQLGSSEAGAKDCHSEQYEDCSDREQDGEKPEEADIDRTIKDMFKMMSNISHLCECYYHSCPKTTLSHTERRHFRAFHKGVLPITICTEQKKVSKIPEKSESPSSSSSTSSSTSSYLCSGVRSHGVRFIDPNISLVSKVGVTNKNSHYAEASDRSQNTHTCTYPLDRTHNLHSGSRITDMYSNRCLPTESESDILTSSNKAQSEGTLCPFSNSSSTCVSFETKRTQNWAKTAKSHFGFQHRKKDDVTGVSLPKNTFVEGISAFPTDNIQPKSSKMKQKAANNNNGQGIYITTKPGTYIVRKPHKKSSIHLLHVNPGNYLKLNL